jgi:hypothetical protein
MTPFADGTTVFSVCGGCPVSPEGLTGASGVVTSCSVEFDNHSSEAAVACCYGPGMQSCWSGANDTETVGKPIPNVFDFCQARCVYDYSLNGCYFDADASGVTFFNCMYETPS